MSKAPPNWPKGDLGFNVSLEPEGPGLGFFSNLLPELEGIWTFFFLGKSPSKRNQAPSFEW